MTSPVERIRAYHAELKGVRHDLHAHPELAFTETVFQWPGMGLLFIQAVTFADVPVMAAYLCLIALFFVVINLTVDLLYYAVDPRLRIQPT